MNTFPASSASRLLLIHATRLDQGMAQQKLGHHLNSNRHSDGIPESLNLLSLKFILLINVKMPTIVGIFTFISTINTASERLKARRLSICRYFSVYEQLKSHVQLS